MSMARPAPLGIFAGAFALLFALMDRRLNVYDEGLVLVDAVRMLHGEVIHRDFYSNYGPAMSGILALLFRLDGHWFLIGRLFGVAVMAGIVAVTHALLAPRARPAIAWAFTGCSFGWLLATPSYLYPLFPCVLFALIGSGLLVRAVERGHRRDLLLAGAAAGATALFRYDTGFFLAAGHLVALALLIGPRRLLSAAGLYALGCAAVFAPFALAFLAIAPASAFVADIISFPLHYYAAMRGLPFPGPASVVADPSVLGVYLPLLAVLVAAPALPRRENGHAFLVTIMLLVAVMYYKGVVRVTPLHMMGAILPSLLLLGIAAERACARRPEGRTILILLVAAVVVPLGGLIARQLSESAHDGRLTLSLLLNPNDPSACPEPPATWLVWQERDYRTIGETLRRWSFPGEPVFVGLDRHDRIFANPVSLYVTAGRPPATHWAQFDPGLQTRADIQARMVAELTRQRVRWVVRDASFASMNEPNGSSVSSGVHLLDRFLDEHYRPVLASGAVSLWLDRRRPMPGGEPRCAGRAENARRR